MTSIACLQAGCKALLYDCKVEGCSYYLDQPTYEQVMLPGNCVQSATHYLCGDTAVVSAAAQAAINGVCVPVCRCCCCHRYSSLHD